MATGFKWNNPGCPDCGHGCGGGFFLPGCPCTRIPTTLYMHVARQPPGHVEAVVFPSPLVLMPPPADLAAYRSDNPGYYSPTDFVSSDLFYKFRYWFGCSQGSYFVGGLITPDSPLGYKGYFLIASFLAGVPGNTCSPFSFASPVTGNPTFAAQGISIDGATPPPPRSFTSSFVAPPASVVTPPFRSLR